MNRIYKRILIAAVFTFTAFGGVQASAALKTRVIKEYSSQSFAENAYHTKNLKKSVWVYNDDWGQKAKPFTKKVFNLKSYPDTTWFVNRKVRTYNKGKSADYYDIANKTGSRRGFVRTSALKKGFSPKGYQIIEEHWGNQAGTFHIKNNKLNTYMWNWSHTKKRANLKDYPGANWYRSETVVMQHNGKKTKYYYLSGEADGTNNKRVSGYVPASNIVAGKNPNHDKMKIVHINDFVNNTDFNHYLQTGVNQKLAREIIKLFPNSTPDLGLSRIAVYNYGGFVDMDGDADPVSTNGYSDFVSFSAIQKSLYKYSSASNATKLSIIKKGLAKAGYTAAKRKSLSGYKLGIQIINNIKSPSLDSDSTHENSYVFILGKKQ